MLVKHRMGRLAAIAAVATVGLSAPAFAAGDKAMSIDDMIAKHVVARGGIEALRAVKTLTMSGKFRPPGFDADLAYSETIVRPGSVRINITLQGLTIVQSYDGASGWQIQPFGGRKDPETLSADDVKSLQEEADFEDPLIDYKAKGVSVTYLGMEDIDGAPTHALHVLLKNGDSQTWYLDPDLWLAVRVTTHTIQRGVETVNETDFGDYEKIGGVWFALEQSSGTQGQSARQHLTYEKIDINTPVDPATFVRPAVKPAAAH
jgi:hypothetical protein